jgi:hypothetical protein
MHYCKIPLLMLLGSSVAFSAYAEEHRQHGSHEHGGGQLNVAVEQNRLMIELSLPAMNVVGFEHAVSNQSERDQVAAAANQLKQGMRLFRPSPAAKCELLDVQVESSLFAHDENQATEEHADFDVSYEFNCAQAAQLKALSVSLFKIFPATHHLRAQVITDTGQTGGELSADKNVVEFK